MDLKNPQSLNRYPYVSNNPTTVTDPSGLHPCFGPPPCVGANFGNEPQGSNWFPGEDFPGGNDIQLPDWTTYQNDEWTSYGVYGYSDYNPGAWAPSLPGGNQAGGIAVLPLPNLSSLLKIPGTCGTSGTAIDSYLQNTPLAGQGNAFQFFGTASGVSPAFLVALAGAESSFGRNITSGAFNAWNWFYNGPGQPAPFSSWAAGINRVARGIAGRYYFKSGLTSTGAIYGRYCQGPDCVNGLRNLNTFLMQLGGNPANVSCP